MGEAMAAPLLKVDASLLREQLGPCHQSIKVKLLKLKCLATFSYNCDYQFIHQCLNKNILYI